MPIPCGPTSDAPEDNTQGTDGGLGEGEGKGGGDEGGGEGGGDGGLENDLKGGGVGRDEKQLRRNRRRGVEGLYGSSAVSYVLRFAGEAGRLDVKKVQGLGSRV